MSSLIEQPERRRPSTQQSRASRRPSEASSRERGRRSQSAKRPPLDPEMTRKLLQLAFIPAALAVALISIVVVVTLAVAGSDLTGTFGAIGALWLATHQIPVEIDGVTLGVLPLVPTLLMVYTVARGCCRASSAETRLPVAARMIGAAMAGPLVITALALAVVSDASAEIPLDGASPLAAFGWVAAIHCLAASVGVCLGTRSWWIRRIPEWVREAIGPMLRSVLILTATGGLITTIALLWNWQTVGDLLGREAHAVDMLGLTVVSILYLPNMVVGAISVLVGANASIGDVSVSVFGNIGGELPPLPLLGAVPSGVSGGFWPILLVLPAAIGAYFGWDCSRAIHGQKALAAVASGAAASGLIVALLAVSSGGELGVLGTVSMNWWLTGLLVFAWLAVIG
ncbi:MAG: hypothetical protein GX542_09795, partial [Rhodococcus sp.]|nr:hypothetical protein [Rhodococcus sp. (in: high G+C Gram-positive bacteria)]